MRWSVHSLNTARGTTLEVFLNGLSADAAADAEALLEMLEEYGNDLRPPISKPLGGGLFEARDPTSGVRLFFMFAPGRRIIVLDGYLKKRTSIPAAIMARVRRLQKETETALRKKARDTKKPKANNSD